VQSARDCLKIVSAVSRSAAIVLIDWFPTPAITPLEY